VKLKGPHRKNYNDLVRQISQQAGKTKNTGDLKSEPLSARLGKGFGSWQKKGGREGAIPPTALGIQGPQVWGVQSQEYKGPKEKEGRTTQTKCQS